MTQTCEKRVINIVKLKIVYCVNSNKIEDWTDISESRKAITDILIT